MTEAIKADVVVIGMGPAGEHVAGSLAERGLAVVGIESDLVGGECPYYGCIPSKMMIRGANLLAEARRVDGFAGTSTVTPDWTPIADRIRDSATDDWNDQVAVDRFVGKGGQFIRGRGKIVAPGIVDVGDQRVEAANVVVATGTSPAVPPIPGLDTVDYWTNRDAVKVKELPDSLLVLGGGAIGAEMAQVMSRFGTNVSVVEALDRILPNEEPEASAVVTEAWESEGIGVHTGVRASEVRTSDADGVVVVLEDGTELTADRLLVATGRSINVRGLGLEHYGLPSDARRVETDEHLAAGEGLWAVGDATGEGLFTHVGMYQANIAIAAILGEDHEGADYSAMSRATFTDPEVGSVGLTESAAADAGINVKTVVQNVAHTARGWLHGTGNEGVIKVVIDADRDVVVGATTVGPHGGEMIAMLALAVHAEVPVLALRSMIYAYPTFWRGIEDALNQLD